jgi:HNH endonuclease
VERRPRITRARLQELLHYDSETGEFHWLKRASRSVREGDIAGRVDGEGYRKITIEGRTYRAHQLAWLYQTGEWCRGVIDHRDGDPSNNRWINLRCATISQNNANRRRHRNNKCGFKGVVQNPWGRFIASIYKDGQRRHLGMFATAEDAHAAYVEAARKLFGEFARAE